MWDKNREYDNQIIDISSEIKYQIYPIYSVLKYNEKKFATLENNGNSFNVKIYEYETQYNSEKNEGKKNKIYKVNKENQNKDNIEEINKSGKKKNKEKGNDFLNKKKLEDKESENKFEEFKNVIISEIKNGKENIEINTNEKIVKNNINKTYLIKNDINLSTTTNNSKNNSIKKVNIIFNNKKEDLKINFDRYENGNNSEDSEENIDSILEEIKINAQKREEEYLKSQTEQKNLLIDTIKRKKLFKEVFNLKYIQFKTEDSSSEEIIQQIVLIKVNDKLFGFLDKEFFTIINFVTCEVVTKISYGLRKLIYIDKTPSNNFLFKEKNKIISYTLRDNDLIRINLPVFEYNKNDKNISSWFLISGSIEFINKAKIIDDMFMISLFELRMEKWNLNNNK